MQPSVAAQIIIAVIPIVGIVMGSLVIFFFLYWHHQQRVLMIEKGLITKKPFDYRLLSLFSGCLLFGVGAGLTLFFYMKRGVHDSVLGGVVPLSVGLSLLLFFVSDSKLNGDKR